MVFISVWINDHYGDVALRTGQEVSTISRKLADKIGLYTQTEIINGKTRYVVRPRITIGELKYEVGLAMLIQEDYFQNPDSFFCPPIQIVREGEQQPEVYLGNGFMREMKMILQLSRASTSTSPLFGSVPIRNELMRKFVKNYHGGTYDTVPDERAILLFDMDCFEVQVHEKPEHKGKPRVVVNSSNRVIAASYEAKQFGVSREATPYLAQAQRKYPQLIPIYIPERPRTTGGPPRPDSSVAREATAKIVQAIQSKLNPALSVFEFSSNDEFYVDLTEMVNSQGDRLLQCLGVLWNDTFLYTGTVIGKSQPNLIVKRIEKLRRKQNLSASEKQEIRLIVASTIGNTIVKEILYQTGFQSSVGIGSNKLIAKIVSGLHKPGSITIVAPSGFENVSNIVKTKDVPGLGGRLGENIQRKYFGDEVSMKYIRDLSVEQLACCEIGGAPIGLEKANGILYNVNGICYKKVVFATCYETSGCTRQFPSGSQFSYSNMRAILSELVDEFVEKQEFEYRVNSRVAKSATMKITLLQGIAFTSSVNFQSSEIYQKLLDEFIGNFNPPMNKYTWNEEANTIKKVQISGTF